MKWSMIPLALGVLAASATSFAEPRDSVLLTGGQATFSVHGRRPSRCDDRSLAVRLMQAAGHAARRRSA